MVHSELISVEFTPGETQIGTAMELVDYSYEGFYARLEPANVKQSGLLMNADCIVGDAFEVFFKTEEDRVVAWTRNRFGAEVGYFDVDTSRRLQIAQGRGQKICCLLAFVAYSDNPEPAHYWAQMALFTFNPAYANEMEAFVGRCAGKLAEGNRPKIDLGSKAVEKIFSEPDWLPSETVPLPKKESGFAVTKDHQTMNEKAIEQARAGNKGCYAISWLFIIAVVAVVLYFAAHLFGIV